MIDKILSFLPENHPWRDSILWFDRIGSTNDQAKELAQKGAPHGTVLIADRQTGGRGRMGRRFESPAGAGVYMSVILRPDCKPEELMHLTCAAAVAACNAVEEAFGFRPGVKWINDLVFDKKKLGGILTELSIDPLTQSVQYAVVGIGINCCQQPEDFPPELRDIATSASVICKKDADRNKLSAALIDAFSGISPVLLSQKSAIMQIYTKDCITLGQTVQVIRGEDRRQGKAMQLDADGGLIVSYAEGTLETVQSGEVSVRGMYGYI